MRCILQDAGAPQEADHAGMTTDRPFPTWDDVVSARDCLTFGNHTHSHRCLRALPNTEAVTDVEIASKLIATRTGHKPELFAFPGGGLRDISRSALGAVRTLGFSAAFAAGTPSRLLLSLPYASSAYGQPRIHARYDMTWDTSLARFHSWLVQ